MSQKDLNSKVPEDDLSANDTDNSVDASFINLENRQMEVLKNELDITRTLYKLSRKLNELETLEDAIQQATDLLADTFDFDRINIITFDITQKKVTHFFRGGLGRDQSVEVQFDELDEGLSGWVIKTHRSALSSKVGADDRESPVVQERRRATNCGAIIVVPILYHTSLLGTITAINRLEQRDFTLVDVDLLETVASHVGVLIERNKVYQDLLKEVELRQQAQGALEKTYLDQERRIHERTLQLAEKNQSLEKEVEERKKESRTTFTQLSTKFHNVVPFESGCSGDQ
jgi:GAF domain-containing protein